MTAFIPVQGRDLALSQVERKKSAGLNFLHPWRRRDRDAAVSLR
jgi:hypothetical protein